MTREQYLQAQKIHKPLDYIKSKMIEWNIDAILSYFTKGHPPIGVGMGDSISQIGIDFFTSIKEAAKKAEQDTIKHLEDIK